MTDSTFPRKALVVGATGLIGRHLVDQLLQVATYSEVRVLVRNPSGKKHAKLREIQFDFDQPKAELVQGDDVFCCLGTTMKKAGSKEAFFTVDYEYPMLIARLSQQNGAQRLLVVTAMGADPESMFFYNRVKGEIEEDLQVTGFDCLHFIRPSLLLGDRKESRLGEKIGAVVMRILDPVMVGPLKKYKAIEAAKVARAMVAIAQRPEKGVFVHSSDELQAY